MGLLSKEEIGWDLELDKMIEVVKKEADKNTFKEHSTSFAGCKIYTKNGTPTNQWKGVYTAEVSAENMVKGITTPIIKLRKEWDSTCVDLKDLKVLDKETDFKLLYSKHAPGSMMSYRDYITVRKTVTTKKRICIASKSVTPSDKQYQIHDKSCVRGEIYFSAFCIDILDSSKCKVTFISHMNLNVQIKFLFL
eukprot:gene8906-854_t